MLSRAKTLKGYKLDGTDGEIGAVKEFYFDDQHWTIRYLVADTGNWLTGRQVLISPYALVAVDTEEHHIGIGLTKKQIEESPSLNTDKPVSRQFEEAYYGHYGWPVYWGGRYIWGASYYPNLTSGAGLGPGAAQGVVPYGLGAALAVAQDPEESAESARDEDTWDPHLRSTHDATGHHIQAIDGEVGHVEDFIIDDKTWAIRYLIIDTRNWWPGGKVLISSQWIKRVSWDDKEVFVNLSRETIKDSPEYTEDALLTRDYETRLHGHYNRQGYWVDEPAAQEASS